MERAGAQADVRIPLHEIRSTAVCEASHLFCPCIRGLDVLFRSINCDLTRAPTPSRSHLPRCRSFGSRRTRRGFIAQAFCERLRARFYILDVVYSFLDIGIRWDSSSHVVLRSASKHATDKRRSLRLNPYPSCFFVAPRKTMSAVSQLVQISALDCT